MNKIQFLTAVSITCLGINGCTNSANSNAKNEGQKVELLNVSYDVSRDFYKEYNELFIDHYRKSHPNITLSIKQSHGGSSKQAMSVANGLQADVVTMNQNSDIDLLVNKNLVDQNWQEKLPNQSVPYTSATVLLVRAGNPKNIQDWLDLTREGVEIVIPNPKTSGNGRYAFLGAYGYGLHTFGHDESKTDAFMQQLLANVSVFDHGARAATTTFTQRGIGDVLITPENEASHIVHALRPGEFEVVYPSYTVATENPVAVVDAVVDKKQTQEVAKSYLAQLYQDDAQRLAAKFYLRPSSPQILAEYQDRFPALTTFIVSDVFGNWDEVMSQFFADGAKFDTLAKQ